MRRAGRTVGIAQNLAVVRCEDDRPPEIGTAVVDERLSRVGRVVDVFGPVERPYLAVVPDDEIDPATTLGATLYIR